eukprot:s1708_g12.t1
MPSSEPSRVADMLSATWAGASGQVSPIGMLMSKAHESYFARPIARGLSRVPPWGALAALAHEACAPLKWTSATCLRSKKKQPMGPRRASLRLEGRCDVPSRIPEANEAGR